MEQIIFSEKDNALIIVIPTKIYTKEAILNCLYWRLGSSKISFSVLSEMEFQVTIDLTGVSNDQKKDLIKSFSNEIIDYELRETVSRETKSLKELIIAKAFANGMLDGLD